MFVRISESETSGYGQIARPVAPPLFTMASLPQKPQESPSRERPEPRVLPDDRDRRPSGPSQRSVYNRDGRHASPSPYERSYVPHRGGSPRRSQMGDSYVASYDERGHEHRRRDFGDRERASWDRPRERDLPPHHDRNSHRGFEREKESYNGRDRPFERHRDSYARPRRGFSPRRGVA